MNKTLVRTFILGKPAQCLRMSLEDEQRIINSQCNTFRVQLNYKCQPTINGVSER